jgi:hypothetical protein
MSTGSLLFLDANILLDFYRVEGREEGLAVLKLLSDATDRIVTGDQIAMEFAKNRQSELLKLQKRLIAPDWSSLNLPPILAEAATTKSLKKHYAEIKKKIQLLNKRLGTIIENPSQKDPVWRAAQKLFDADTKLNLSRQKQERFAIRELAKNRFILGYPPRKAADTSIGDAINWEWLVHCASRDRRSAIIVSRDNDYGDANSQTPRINDWLREEFSDRVAKNRKVVLTNKLSTGLKLAGISISAKQRKVIDNASAPSSSAISVTTLANQLFASQTGSQSLTPLGKSLLQEVLSSRFVVGPEPAKED